MATSAQGLTFTFGGSTVTVTSVQVNDTQDLLDATHLGVAPNARRLFVGGFATDREVDPHGRRFRCPGDQRAVLVQRGCDRVERLAGRQRG